MSSRNALLSDEDRTRALSLSWSLQAAAALAASGERSAQALLAAAHAMLRRLEVEPEYVALVDPDTLEPIDQLSGEALLAIAARIGEVRLIDNVTLSPAPADDDGAAAGKRLGQPLPGKANATCSA
jgi:pantoate--beta-alanine ligase